MPLQNYNDQELLLQWKNGSKVAFKLLFDRHFNKLLQFALKRLNNRELAEELVMDVLMRLWQQKDQLYEDTSLSPYLFRSVMNGIIDHLRKKTIQTTSVDNVVEENLASPSLEEHLHQKELHQIYLKTLTSLSPKRKRTFELSRLEGKSHKEIATEMDISVSTVKQHINATLGVLRETMKEHTDIAFLICLVLAAL